MSTSSVNISSEILAAAAQRRLEQKTPPNHETQRIQDYNKRQNFRRLINPGILERNSRETAMSALRALMTISKNLLREPENPKFQQFKPTNDFVKRTLIDPKGTVEYAIALGFRPEVRDFQPYYTFNPKKVDDLRVGLSILQEALDLEVNKQEHADRAKREEKATREAVAKNIKLALLEDRKTRELRDQRERQSRAAHQTVV